jgi:hypothetical protein
MKRKHNIRKNAVANPEISKKREGVSHQKGGPILEKEKKKKIQQLWVSNLETQNGPFPL